MPAVNVQDSAHTDPRLTACARALRMSRPALLVACMQLWSRVLAQGHTRMRVELVAGTMARKTQPVSAAMGLYGLAHGDGHNLDLEPMADLFAGGAATEDAEQPLDASDARRLQQNERQARRRSRMRHADVTPVERDMSRSVTLDVTPESVTVTRDTPSPLSPPTTPPNTPTPENLTPHAGACDPGEPVTRQGLGVFSQLYEKHVAVVAAVAPKGAVKLLGAVNVLHKIRECLNHPSIREQDQAAIERALELLGVQAKAKADAGESDPWWLLENAWSPGVLEKALACRDEDTARMRAVKRLRGGPRGGGGPMPPPTSQPPNSHEYFAELARQQQAEKESQNVPPDQTP